ncbi:hypothetical protein Tco_1182881 [Tanacetum coccineum]
MHQPWRTLTAIINRWISRKTTGLDKLKESRVQIIWAMFYKKNVDYVALLINMHTTRNDSLLGTLKFVSKTEDYQKYGALIPDGMINQEIKDSKAYKTYIDLATGKATPKKARKSAKKSVAVPTTGVVIRDTSGVSVSKKKAPAKADRGKGIELLSDVAILEATQLKKVIKRSKQDTHRLHASGLSEGADFESKVHDESKAKSSDTSEGTDSKDDDESDDNNDKDSRNDDDGDSDAHDSERTNSDEEEIPNPNLKGDEEEESKDEEYVRTPNDEFNNDYNEFNEEEYDEFGTQDKSYEQVVEDAHVTLTASQKTEGSKQSSSVVGYVVQTAFSSYTTAFEKEAKAEQDRFIEIIDQSIKDMIKDKKSKSYQAAPEHKKLYDGLIKSYNLDKDLFSSYGKSYSLKRDRKDEDKDEDPPAGSNQGFKRRKTSKDADQSKGSKLKDSRSSSSSKGTTSQPKSSDDQPDVEAASKQDWFKKPDKPLTPDREWNTRQSVNFRPPRTWISNIAKAKQPPRTFDELISTPIDFSIFVMNILNVEY